MRLTIGAATIFLMFSAVVWAQLSPDEAEQRMQDRIAQEKAAAGQEAVAATQPSNLTIGQVAQLYKTITQQQNEIAQLTAEVQQLKDKFSLSQLNLRNAQATAAAAANASPNGSPAAAPNTPNQSDINAAMSQHTLAVGMTLDQCNTSIGSAGKNTGADDSGEARYEWNQLVGRDNLGNPQALIRIDGVIQDGKLVSFTKADPVPFNVGSAGVYDPGQFSPH
jgi:hypothetical protein